MDSDLTFLTHLAKIITVTTEKFIILDLANTFYRCRHIAMRGATPEDQVGMTIHSTLSSIAKCWREQRATHLVVALEGRSWRRDFYEPYKRGRREARAQATPQEQAVDQMFWTAHDDLVKFFKERTNCTVLQNSQLEADDLIAGWCQENPQHQHVIISSDTDYQQLISETVTQYNGVMDEHYTLSGVFNGLGKPVKDKKTGNPKPPPNPQWLLFEKCMKGDSTDNVFSAYPGVRLKGTKNRVGLMEAFADRNGQGWAWNNMMLQRFVDADGIEHVVRDLYQRNRTLIDLTAQPPEIRELIKQTVDSATPLDRPLIGSYFLKFCAKHQLIKLSENTTVWNQILTAPLRKS